MAVKAKAEITISRIIDIDKFTTYYLLQSSTLAAPSKPKDGATIGSNWSKTEPSYSSGSTMTLYSVNQTIMSNGAIKYSEVSKSSSYEAAKEAWNKANNAQNTANSANMNLNKLTGDASNYSQLNDATASNWGFTKDSTADGHWYTMNKLCRDTFISNFFDCYGSKKFRIQFEVATSVQANTTNSTTTITKKYATVSVGIYCFDDNGKALYWPLSKGVTGSENTTTASVDSVVTTHADTRKFRVAVQISGWNNFSGTLKIRNIRVTALDQLASVDVEYYLSTSATSLAGGSWTTTAPTWVNGKYMWSRTVKTDGAGNKTYSPSQNGVCIAGATGAKGDKGDRGATGATGPQGPTGGTGPTGKGVKSIVEQYYKSTSATSLAGGSWSNTYPGWENGKYIWTRSVITYTDNATTTTTAVCVTGQKGDTGAKGDKGATGNTGPQGPQGPQGNKGDTGATGNGIKSTTITYQLCASRTTAPTGTWLPSPPATDIAKPYLWTRTVLTYTNGSTSTSYSVSSTFDSLQVGGRNLILNSKGDTKAGFFKYFTRVTDEYAEVTLKSKKQYASVTIEDGFSLGVRDYIVGEKYIWSYDIMYTAWNFPSGSNRTEFWMGQRYTNAPSGQTGTGAWRSVTNHNLPVVGSNGCKLNEWYHVTQVVTIPTQASANIGEQASIQFYNSSADVEASFTARIKNVKLERGNIATDWTPAPEDLESRVTSAESSISNNSKEIKLKASQETVTALSKDYNAYKKTTTEFTQDIDGWRMDWNKLISTDEAEVASHQDYITFKKGDIILGDSASNLKLKLTKNSIQFKGTGDTEVTPDSDATAWITGKTFHIDTGEIKSSLKFGNILMKPTSGGNLAIGEVAEFGSTVRIGLSNGRNTKIDSNGLTIKNGSALIAQLGYDTVKDEIGNDVQAPFYTFGIRKPDSAVGAYSVAQGYNVVASASDSSAFGSYTQASGGSSHAEGYYTTASNNMSHAEGTYTTAKGYASHSEGGNTTSIGNRSHAEGGYTSAGGECSHAEGNYTIAGGMYSHAGGDHTKALSRAQTVIGSYNIADDSAKYLFIVGNGTAEDKRSNAFTVSRSGDVEAAGGLHTKGSEYLDMNNTSIYGTFTDGSNSEMLRLNTKDELLIGYGQYGKASVATRLYGGNKIAFHLKNPAASWIPYYTKGDSVSVKIYQTGFITNNGKELMFFIPLSRPIVGVSTVAISSIDGLTVRQNGDYCFSKIISSSPVKPKSYSASVVEDGCGINIKATFTDTTNVQNNDSCGVYASIKITFS